MSWVAVDLGSARFLPCEASTGETRPTFWDGTPHGDGSMPYSIEATGNVPL